VDLANEKGSAYITAHVLGDSELGDWISAGSISTADYAILASRGHLNKPFTSIMDDILSFNSFDWQVRGKKLFYNPIETDVTYFTHARHVRGSVKQDLADFANKILYNYKDLEPRLKTGSLIDSASAYPVTHKAISLGDGITLAEARQLAELHLTNSKSLRSSSGVTVNRIWGADGNDIPLTMIEAGKNIRIDGVVVDAETLSNSYSANDVDTFRIAQVGYDNDRKNVTLSPGKVASRLPVILARMELRK
jgi:hypothetical protein